jgi:succinate dehydrogenase hydrophobic anchor subunit
VRWWGTLGLLAAVRVAIPLAAYADRGARLPGLPRVVRARAHGGLSGDATGFYAATREFMAGWARMPHPLLGLLVVVALAAVVALVVAWRRRPDLRPWLAPAAVCAFGLLMCIDVHWMKPSGAAVFGWPLVWGIAELPFRATGLLTQAVGWDVSLVLQLGFVALTVVAVAYLARNASGRRWVGVLAAACWAFWPLLVGVIAGHHAWTNAQWEVDVGLHGYSEPLSTLLVVSAAALKLSERATPLRLSNAG